MELIISNNLNWCNGIQFYVIINLLLCSLKCTIQANNFYTVIAANTLESKRIYTVSVGSHNAEGPVQFDIKISGPSYNETNSAELPPDTLLDMEFEIPFLEQGEYRLMIESSTAFLMHRNATELRIKENKIFAFDEIEKKVYQPGEIVKFRVFLFDSNFIPLDIRENVRVYYTKSDGLFIKVRHLNVSNKGLLTGFAQLPDSEADNWWQIDVYLGDKVVLKSGFEVRKIALDYYDVHITATPKVSIKHPNLKINISSKFKYGQPVEGNVNLGIKVKCCSDYEVISAPKLNKIIDMHNGQAELDLNLINYKEYIQPDQYCDLEILAEVQPLHFHVMKKAFTSSKLIFNQYEIKNLKDYIDYYLPNKMHFMNLLITNLNGSAIKKYKKMVTLIYIQEVVHQKYPLDAPQPDENSRKQASHVKLKKLKFLSYLNESGHCTFKVMLPKLMQIKGFKNQFRAEVIFDRELHKISTLLRQNGSDDTEIYNNIEGFEELYQQKKKTFEITSLEKYNKFLSGQKYDFTINSLEAFSYITYNLIARGNILQSKRVEFPEKTNRFNMSLEISADMFPRTAIYAYFIDENGNFHSDEKLLPITLNFTNKIEVSAPAEAEPGSRITLKIKTTPNSKIALLGFDQKYVDPRSSKNYDKVRYFQQLLSEENIWRPFRDYVSYYPGTDSGVYTITNAHYDFEHKKYIYGNQNDDDLASEYDLYDNNQMSFEMILPNQERKNKKLQNEMQSFDIFDIKSSENGEISWNLTVPNAITNWIISATSWNPSLEIGMAETSFELKVTKQFFIYVFSPENDIKRGADIEISVRLTNNYNEAIDVQLVLEENPSKFELNHPSKQSLHISANDISGAFFMIRPKVFGIISLKILGLSSIGNDVVETTINVLPEGNVAPLQNHTYGINLFEMPDFQEKFVFDMPKDALPNSQIIKMFISSDLVKLLTAVMVQTSHQNEEKTLETTLRNYLSNNLLLKHKKAKKTITPKMEKKMQKHNNLNYEKLLSYRLKDGSFKVFDNRSTGSTFWTANVLLSIDINAEIKEDNIIPLALEFLTSRQTENGSFIEHENTDTSHSKPMDDVLLTAFVLLAFLENDPAYSYQMVVKRGLAYLKEQEINIIDKISKDLVGFVLSKSGVGKSSRSAEFRRITLGQKYDMRSACWCYFYENQVQLDLCLVKEILKNYNQNTDMSISIKTTGVEPLDEIIHIIRTSSDSFYLEAPLGTESVTISSRGMGLATVTIIFSYYT